jgi:hypothetical protein
MLGRALEEVVLCRRCALPKKLRADASVTLLHGNVPASASADRGRIMAWAQKNRYAKPREIGLGWDYFRDAATIVPLACL